MTETVIRNTTQNSVRTVHTLCITAAHTHAQTGKGFLNLLVGLGLDFCVFVFTILCILFVLA